MTIFLSDAVAINDRRNTGDGYLVATARAARQGIQIYRGAEVGKPEMAVVRVLRPEAEVFGRDSLSTYAHKPITVDHPPQAVSADNWRQHAVGHIGDEVVRDGDFVRIPLLMADASAIQMLNAGKKELSVGYRCEVRFEPGVTASGETYDAVQHAIRVNHVALVERGRAGADCRIGDSAAPPAQLTTFIDHLPAHLLQKITRVIEDTKSAEIFRVQSAAQAARQIGDELARTMAGRSELTDAARYVEGLQDRANARVAALGGKPTTKDSIMNVNDSLQSIPHGYTSKYHYALRDLRDSDRMIVEMGIRNASGLLHSMQRDMKGQSTSGQTYDSATHTHLGIVTDSLSKLIDEAQIRLHSL